MPDDATGGPGDTSGGVSGAVVDGSEVDAIDVFISYGSSDMGLARELRSHLQAGGYRCWMAPDDVAGPKTWAEQIVVAIAACKVMLVLVSSVSNASDHVSKEVDLAIEHGKAILPVRIEDVVPSGALRYLLALAQWIDAFPGPLGPHADEVKRRVAAIVSSEPAEAVTAGGVEPGGAHPIEQLLEPSPAEPKSTAAASRPRPAFFKWMVIGVVAALVLGGGLTALLLTRDGGPYEYGDDTRLDWLWDRCDAGDMESCDAMTAEADSGTDYFFFGETCGERVVGGGDCAGRGIDDEGSFGYGDDPGLDELWDACNAGTMVACDELAAEAPPDSEYAAFGHTCGERTDGEGECASRGEASISLTYGDDPFFDELWDRCNAEDFTACSELFELAPPETEYEWFGGSCGGRTEFPQGCGPLLIEGGELDALAEACAAGDMEGCWMLYELSPLGSEYEEFGLTCGGLTDGSMPCVFTYGDSPYLDEMWDGCAEGNMEVCDLLYVESPVDSEYEDFGWTCGWRTDGGEDCAG